MIVHYFRLSIRNLLQYKLSASVNVVGLAIGLICGFGVLLYINYERGFDAFHPEADRIYRLVNDSNATIPPAIAPALKRELPEVVDYVRLKPPNGAWVMQKGDRRFYENLVYWCDGSLFNLFTFHLIQGDPTTALAVSKTVVINERTAHKYFGDDDPMGQIIRADGLIDLMVTGIIEDIPSNSHLDADFFVSAPTAQEVFGDAFDDWKEQSHYTYLLLSPQTSPDELVGKIPALIQKETGEQFHDGATLQLQPLRDIHLYSHLNNEPGNNNTVVDLYLLGGLAILLVLMSCFNFINLTTAHAMVRFREIGIRKTLGATRRQLIRQFIFESLVTVMFAAITATGIMVLVFPSIEHALGLDIRGSAQWSDWSGLVVLTLLVGLISGGYIALFMSAFPPMALIRSQQQGPSQSLHRKGLVVFQAVLMILLLIGTQILSDQLHYIQRKPLGLNTSQVLILRSSFGEVAGRSHVMKEELLQQNVIEAMTWLETIPGQPGGGGKLNTIPVQRMNRPAFTAPNAQIFLVGFDVVSTLSLDLLAGRTFSWDFFDDWEKTVINETAARALGYTEPAEAIGEEILLEGEERRTVIGVVKDFHMRSLHQAITPMLLVVMDNLGGTAGSNIAVRIKPDDPLNKVAAIEAAWYRHFPEFPFDYSFLDGGFAKLYQRERMIQRVFQGLTFIAVTMACLGLLGLSSFMTTRRIKEIGIRKVLGARVMEIGWLLSKEIVLLTLCANAIAWPVAYLAVQAWLATFAYHVAIGLSTFILAGFTAFMIAVLSVGYHVFRATTANPIQALRYE